MKVRDIRLSSLIILPLAGCASIVEGAKDGFEHASTKVPAHFGAATAGNILAGGVIGIGIDAATGANYSYPSAISVPMSATTATPPTPATVSWADTAKHTS